MTTFWLILSMVIIGAFVGSSTNAVAIKMLFRPHQAKFIGKWQVPFTPGIIPKRKQELAHQLGNLVMNHLVTSDGIKDKLVNEKFQQEMQQLVENMLLQGFSDERTLEQIFKEKGIPISQDAIKEKLEKIIEQKYEESLVRLRPLEVKELLPEKYIQKWESQIPVLADEIINRGVNYFEGPKGRDLIRGFYQTFLEEKQNSLAKMMQMFLKTIDVAAILQPEIIKFLQSETTKQTIEKVLQKEYEELLTTKVSFIEDKLRKENIMSTLLATIFDFVQLEKYMNMPINELFANHASKWSKEISTYGVNTSMTWIINNTDNLLKRLELEKIVQQQVESFPTEKLEKIIIEIAGKELKMITILGGVLGGAIGLIQGLISVLFLS